MPEALPPNSQVIYYRVVRLSLLFLCLVVRVIALNADPPSWLSWSTGIYTDEGFYTLDARHEALFGTAAPGNFHDRLLSPLLSLMQQGAFEVFGPGLLQARLISVAFGLLTIIAFWLGLRRAYDTRTADLGTLFLGLAPPFVCYNRLALQETPTVFWLVLAFALWAQAGRFTRWMSGAVLALAFVFKGLAVFALPVALVGPPAPILAQLHPTGSRSKRRRGRSEIRSVLYIAPQNWGGGAILFALYLTFWYGPHHAELSRMAAFYRNHQMQPHSALSVWLNLRRGLVGGERGVVPYLLALTPVLCLLAAWRCGKWRRWTQADRYLAVWLSCGLLFCLLSSYAPSRYYVLFLPPLAGLAARGLTFWKRPAQLVFVSLFLLISGLWLGASWARRTYSRQEASRELVRVLPPGSVVIGEFAPTLCLDTPFAAAPVQPGLSNDDRPVERLHATAVAVTRTPFWQKWWRARYPGIVQPSQRILTLTLGGRRQYMVDIYAVKSAEK